MNRTFKTALVLMTLSLFVGCDQVTKNMAKDEFTTSPRTLYLNGILQFVYTENPGSFMSLGSNLPEDVHRVLHLAAATVVMAGLVLLIVHIQHIARAKLVGFSFLMGGACGNLLDRFINHGRVIDFIMIDIGWAHTGVFNVADLLITTGVGIMLVSARIRTKHEP